jgi:Zn-dependent protease with chaperone function
VLTSFEDITSWFGDNSQIGIGIFLIFIGFFFTISEIRVYFKHQSPSDQLLLWLMVFISGIVTIIFNDFVFGLLLGISVVMIVETVKLWDVPVWGKLMAATTASYLVILMGKAAQILYDYIKQPEKPNEFYFSLAFNISFFVFIGVAFVFFGRKFILVSRLSSPAMIYLFLFGVIYGGIIALQRKEILFERVDGVTQSYNYLNISADWADRVIFANFGTFELLTLTMIFMYLISGWLLNLLFGVKPVTDPEILAKVDQVRKTMGIKQPVKVGFVSAPILNAFAYGPFFDKRIAFMASDIKEFRDSDIRGIVGHELAHTSKNHVIILLMLSVFELGVKKALGFPATTLDYSFLPDEAVQNISFAGYYIFSYGFLVVLMIVVRTLEGHADKVTKEAGYGEDLCKALFRLEGFYHGVASDFGISVNLLTDRKYTIAERRRFTALAGSNLYSEVLTPTRGSAFANVFQSHPRTSYRIASIVTNTISPIRGAFFPYRLLGFGLRKNAIKELNQLEETYSKIIDETYLSDYTEEALHEVLKYNPIREAYQAYMDKTVITYNQISKEVIHGNFTNLTETTRVTSPLSAQVNNKTIDVASVVIREYYPDQSYFLRNGSIVTLLGFSLDAKKGLLMEVQNGTENIEVPIQKLGKPVSFVEDLSGKNVVVFEKGLSKLKTIESIKLGDSWSTSELTIDGDVFKGSTFIVDFPPLGFEIRKDKLEEQEDLLKHLINKKILIYTKDNFDVSLSGTVTSITDKMFTIVDADGSHDIDLKRLEYVIYNEHIVELVTKEHISFFTKFGIRWNNRNEFNYIFA